MLQIDEKRESFSVDWSTLMFVAMNIATLNTFMYIWIWRFTNRMSEDINRARNRTIAILIFAFIGWSSAISAMTFSPFAVFGPLLSIAAVILIICLSFLTRPAYEKFLRESGTPINLNGFLCFIIPFYYQYYLLYNAATVSASQNAVYAAASAPAAPADDIATKIEKLSKLKESGAISEEQFEAAKKKLLS